MARGLGPVGACVSPVPLRAAPRSLALSCFEQQRVAAHTLVFLASWVSSGLC